MGLDLTISTVSCSAEAEHPVLRGRRDRPRRHGVLDRPPEPVIRPAKGRTGWRTMTAGIVSIGPRLWKRTS